MKYAFSILFMIIATTFTSNASARTITTFRDSEAITTVAQFMYDVAEDIPVSTRITDKIINIKDFSKCSDVTANDVLADFEKSVKRVLRFYPDEEIPFEQALIDMEDYLDGQTYKKCLFENKSRESSIKTTYYTDLSDKIHLRLDNVALTAE